MKRLSIIACALLTACGGDAPDPAPTVATAEVIRGGFSLEREDHAVPVIGPTRVEHEAEATCVALMSLDQNPEGL